MYETRTMALEIRKMTIVAIVVVAIGAFVIYPSGLKSISMGILIGGFSGLWGFAMIVSLCERIDGSTMNAKAYAFRSYTRRYLMYAVVFVLSVSQGANIFALLAGMLLHKGSILLYTWKHRKEDD